MMPQQPRPGRAPVFVLVIVAVLLAGAAVWMLIAAGSATDDADQLTEQARLTQSAADQAVDPVNRALTDPEATDEVTTQVRTAIEQTFTYDHADLDATATAADRHLTGEARCQYDQIFAEVKKKAATQRLGMRTAVRDVALVQLTDDQAEALVFIDQSVTRGDQASAAATSSQFVVEARLEGDTWRLTSFDFIGQSLVGGGLPPEC